MKSMLKGLFYISVALLLSMIVFVLIWITKPVDDPIKLEPLENTKLNLEFDFKPQNTHLETIDEPIIENKPNSNIENEVLTEIEKPKKAVIVEDESIETQKDIDNLWKNDPYLEELAIKHLKYGLSEQELELLFERRFEKDITNALLIFRALEFFFEGETQYKNYGHLSSSQYDLDELKRAFPNSKVFEFDRGEIQDEMLALMDRQINGSNQEYYAYMLMDFFNSYQTLLPVLPRSIMGDLIEQTKFSQNPKIQNTAQTYERFLHSNEALIDWILAGNDQYYLFVKCECLIKSALSMSLSESQWIDLLMYYSKHSTQYVVQIVKRLKKQSVNIDYIWAQLILKKPKLSAYSNLLIFREEPSELQFFDDESKLIIHSLWRDYFDSSGSYENWEQTWLKNIEQNELDDLIASVTWADILNQAELVFQKSKVDTYLNKLTKLDNVFKQRGKIAQLAYVDFSQVTTINELMFEMFESESFDPLRLKEQWDQLVSDIPISIRIDTLNFEVILYMFSQSSHAVDSQSVFLLPIEAYNKWDYWYQDAYILFEFIYLLKNQSNVNSDRVNRSLNSSIYSQLQSLINVYCIMSSYYLNSPSSQLNDELKVCQNIALNYFFESYGLEKNEKYEQIQTKMEEVTTAIDVESLYELWRAKGFNMEWLGQLGF